MSTYNRGQLLGDAIGSVLAQRPRPNLSYELLVVDNNSTDGTRQIIEGFAHGDARVHYVFEPRQGLSFARNAGIRVSRAPLVAFTDDDVRVDAGWVESIVRAFDEHPEAGMVGGRVLPIWPSPPPSWLTRDHWAPLALADHGDRILAVTPNNPICLIGANVAYRRGLFEAVGMFQSDFQRVKDGVGSLEDHDFLLRLLRHGYTGIYDPRIEVHAEIQPDRLDRSYHRRWHTGHGHFHALLRSEAMERTTVGRIAGVPAHLYRQALADVTGWIAGKLTANEARAFRHELRLRFFRGFVRTRRHDGGTRRPDDRQLHAAETTAGHGRG